MFKTVGKKFKWIINSKGTKENLEYKKEWLEENLPDIDYELVLMPINWTGNMSKSHLKADVIIDDRLDVLLDNKSRVKILLKNFRDTDYNGGIGKSREELINSDIYVVNDFKEILDILLFVRSWVI